MSTHYSLNVLRIQDVVWDSRFHSKVPNLYVSAKLGDIIKKTRTIEKDRSPTWNEILTLSSSNASSVINIQVRHKSLLKDPCVGYIDIQLADLLEKCIGDEAQLRLESPSRKTSAGVLHLRLESINAMASVDVDVKAAGRAVQQRGIVRSAEAVDFFPVTFVNAANQLSGDADLYNAIGSLFSKLDAFVRVIDALSEVHPYLKVAWQVTSALYKGISNQFQVDKKIIDLVRVLEDAFNFVHDVDSLPDKVHTLEQTIIRLLKQTTECCLFVQNYTQRGFASRMLSLSNSGKIDEFRQSLSDLKVALDSGVILYTALVSARVSDAIDALSLRDRLNPHQTDAFNRRQCLLGTRVETRNKIMDWMLSSTDQNILWLHGVAGSGKSTVSTTIAEYFRGLSRLGTFLFFERGKSEPASVIRTIAYGLASFDCSIAKSVIVAIKQDNDIATASAANQFEKLLLEPLTAASVAMQGPVVVVLDALDECGTVETRRNLVQLLQREFPKLPKNFRFLITSRREPDINQAFSSQPSIHTIELDYRSTDSQDDVLRYIDHEMCMIMQEKEVKVPANWPWKANMKLLSNAAGGLFIWGSTAIKLVNCDNPFRMLQDLVSNSRSLNSLKQLYDTVLERSGISFDNKTSKTRFSQVVGTILLSKIPLSDITVDGILGFPSTESSHLILSRLQCVLVYSQGAPIHFFHASFTDYLLSSERSGEPWCIDVLDQKALIAERCFDVMKNMLRFNICNLESSFVRNDNVPGLQDRIEENIPAHLSYSCLFWAQHLCEAPFSATLLNDLSSFLYKRLLYWLEVLSLLKKVNGASPALLQVMSWTAKCDAEISAFLRDARRLVTLFASPISQATPHIYLSALPLSAKESKVAAFYLKRASSLVQVYRRGLERQSPLLKQIEGHTDLVTSVGFSPDGTRVVSGSGDKMIRVWDVESGEVVSSPFEGHTDVVTSVGFSPDGTRIVSGSNDNTIRVWDVESGEVVSSPFEGHMDVVTSVSFSPDGTRVVSGSDDETVRVWDVESGEVVSGPFEGHLDCVTSVAFSSDGTRIVSGSCDKTIRVWDIESREVVSGPFEGHMDWVTSVGFSPDGTRIVSGSHDKTIRVWDVESGEVVSGPFEGHVSGVMSVSFSPDGTRVVSGSGDKTIRVWDVESGEVVSGPFEGHMGWVTSVGFSPDGTRIVSGSRGATISVWDVESGEVVSGPFEGHMSRIMSVGFSSDGTRVVSGSRDATIRVWDVESGEVVSSPFEGHMDVVTSVGFSPDGTRIVSGSRDATIRVWDVESGEVVSDPFEGHMDWVMSVSFSPDGTRVASGSHDRTIRVWDVESGEVVSDPFKGHMNGVASVAFSPDGTCIVSGSYDKTIRVWDMESGEVVSGPFEGHMDGVVSVAFSPDGTCIVSGSYDKTIRVWDVESGEVVSGPFEGHMDGVASVAFSPDGTCIVSGSYDKTIRVWDVESGEVVSGPFEGHMDGVVSVAFSPDGTCIVSGSYDKTIRVWDVESGEVVSSPFEGHMDVVTSVSFSPDGTRIVSGSYDKTIRVWDVESKEIVSASSEGLMSVIMSAAPVLGKEVISGWILAEDGWILGENHEMLLWIPLDLRLGLLRPQNSAVLSCAVVTELDFRNSVHGNRWHECFKPF